MDFVSRHPEATIFHHAAWLSLLKRQYGFRVFALCSMQGDSIAAGLPLCEVRSLLDGKRWVCLPFSDHCGPLAPSETDCAALLGKVQLAAAEQECSLEIRDGLPRLPYFEATSDHWLHVKQITGFADQIHRDLHPDIRRRIRKAQNARLVNEMRTDPQAMDIFYNLHLLTRRRQGVPIQQRSYFDNLQRAIVDAGLGFVAVTSKDSRPLSAAVFCTFSGTLMYKYGASDPAALDLNPNYLMFWEAIRFASQSGLSKVDFGKTSIDNEGLRFFKNKWGSTESMLHYTFTPHAPSPAAHGGVMMNVAKVFIQRSPLWVCRLAGELLYKRFAA